MQTINVEPKVSINLDQIVEYILDNLEEKTPAFVRDCDHQVDVELHDYTKLVIALAKGNQLDTMPNEQVAEIVEAKAPKLLDGICAAHNAYLEAGIHIGANLLWQLLDL